MPNFQPQEIPRSRLKAKDAWANCIYKMVTEKLTELLLWINVNWTGKALPICQHSAFIIHNVRQGQYLSQTFAESKKIMFEVELYIHLNKWTNPNPWICLYV